MFKLENINPLKPDSKDKETEKSEVSSLQKIRDHSKNINPVLKSVALGAAIIGGLEIGEKIYHDKVEKDTEKTRSEAYLIKKTEHGNDNVSEILNNNDFISEVALCGDKEINFSITNRDYCQKILEEDMALLDKDDIFNLKKQIIKDNARIKQAKERLDIRDIELAKEKMAKIVSFVEDAKDELMKHISSDEYLDKLPKEMNISKGAAAEHQKIRVINIRNLSYEFKKGDQIFMDSGGGCAYYLSSTNKIVLPFDRDLTDSGANKFFYETILHEILHESTQYEKGMSYKSIETLEKSFKTKYKDEPKEEREYYNDAGELIVRKQILDLEMEKLGLKKYGEKFTNEHYKKLLILKEENKLSSDALDFISHIKPEDFPKVINDLAELKNSGGTYYHSDWDYNQNPEA
jgi:hypothetical protein